MNITPATIALLLVGFGAILAEKEHGAKKSSGVSFCYKDEDGCGPSTSAWPQICQKGQRQSPIDLPQTKQHGTIPLRLSRAYKGDSFRIQNTGHSVSVDFVGESGKNEGPSSKVFSFPDPLNMTNIRDYKFASMHFHWGVDDNVGSEHTVKGVSKAMEVHFVHYLANYSTLAEAVASGHESSLTVLGLFIDVKGVVSSNFAPIVDNLQLVKEPSHDGGFVTVRQPLDLTRMLVSPGVNSLPEVYTYKGSLTTPGCNEQVNWFVLKNPATVPARHLEVFRSTLKDSRGKILNENHRPVLDLNGRKISLKIVKPTD